MKLSKGEQYAWNGISFSPRNFHKNVLAVLSCCCYVCARKGGYRSDTRNGKHFYSTFIVFMFWLFFSPFSVPLQIVKVFHSPVHSTHPRNLQRNWVKLWLLCQLLTPYMKLNWIFYVNWMENSHLFSRPERVSQLLLWIYVLVVGFKFMAKQSWLWMINIDSNI